jgi:dephospho-CoA kinase
VRVGLTGGIGAGKSAVAAIFARLGAFIIDTDSLGREVVAPGSAALSEIAVLWPSAVKEGTLDRTALAEIVFRQPAELERLNALLHPRIRKLAADRESGAKPGQTIVHVVPLLFETGYDSLVDKSVLVAAPLEERIARIVERDGMSGNEARARVAAQIAPEAARIRADYVIENDGTLEQLEARTRAVYEALA